MTSRAGRLQFLGLLLILWGSGLFLIRQHEQDIEAIQSRQEANAMISALSPLQAPSALWQQHTGILIFKEENILLPLLQNWNTNSEQPGIYQGSLEENNLILSGHNSRSQFSFVHHLQIGDQIQILDSWGFIHTFTVTESFALYPDQQNVLVSKDQSWDLTLFTCTWDNRMRQVVRLKNIQSE